MPRFFLENQFLPMKSSPFLIQKTNRITFVVRVPLAMLLALSWLIVNHTMPWPAFYSDALAALVLWVVSLFVLSSREKSVSVPILFFWVCAIALLPWVQFGVGKIFFFGTAWIHSFYLLGFAVAVLVGYDWERYSEGQCLDFLFLAIVIASICSVAIQIIQWMALDIGSLFILQPGRDRYDANLGQPNQLASLLLLGVCGVAWGYIRGFLNAHISVLLLVYLLTGVVLTGSRTAWVNVAGLVFFLSVFWKERKPEYLKITLFVLAAYFYVFGFIFPTISNWMFSREIILREATDPIRLLIWKICIDAVINGPLFGYGWGQSISAALINPAYPNQSIMSYAHNLFLDLMVGNGLLVGGFISAGIIYFFWRFVSYTKRPEVLIPFVSATVLMVHAMLEYPLHYAYFLLPCGMFVGILCFHSRHLEIDILTRRWFVTVVLMLGVMLMATIHDCVEAERTYFAINYSKRNQEVPVSERPHLYFLNQWEERLKLANMFRSAIEDSENRHWIWSVLVTTPDPVYAFNLAQNYAANGNPLEASYWLGTMCKMSSVVVAQRLSNEWSMLREGNPEYASVGWDTCFSINGN